MHPYSAWRSYTQAYLGTGPGKSVCAWANIPLILLCHTKWAWLYAQVKVCAPGQTYLLYCYIIPHGRGCIGKKHAYYLLL